MSARGIGGIFLESEDPKRLREWYREHLGIDSGEDGAVFEWRPVDRPDALAQTVWHVFSEDSEYFDPSDSECMVNYRVEDLEATLDRLTDEGVEQVGAIEDLDYGRFGWVMDPDGNKVELWEPPESAPFDRDVPDVEAPELEGTWACPPGTTVAEAGDRSDRVLHKATEVELPVAEVWRLWTTEEGMAEWWVPNNDIELRVGGSFELYMMEDAPEGLRGSDDCRILSYVPERMLSFTWNAPPNFEYTRPRHTHVVVEFEPLAEERTAVDLSHLGWPDDDWDAHSEWAETYEYFDDAWERVLALLAEHGET